MSVLTDLFRKAFPKSILITALVLLIALPLLNADEKKNLTVGWEPWEPYQYKAADGSYTGLDFELLKAIAEHAGYKLTYTEVPWKRHLIGIESGDIDIALGASKTQEREVYAYFTEAYRTEKAVMFVRKGDGSKYPYKSVKDLANANFQLGVTREYYYGADYEQLSKNTEFMKKVQVADNDEVNYKKLVGNRINGFFSDPYAGTAGLKKAGLLSQVEQLPMKVYEDDIFIMISKKANSTSVLNDFNKSLKELKANGTIDKIFQKYLQ